MAQVYPSSGNKTTHDIMKTMIAFYEALTNQQRTLDFSASDRLESMGTANLENSYIERQDNSPLAEVLTVNQLAELLSISRPIAYQLVKQEGFPSFRIGKNIRINKRMLQGWLDRQCAESKGAAYNA